MTNKEIEGLEFMLEDQPLSEEEQDLLETILRLRDERK